MDVQGLEVPVRKIAPVGQQLCRAKVGGRGAHVAEGHGLAFQIANRVDARVVHHHQLGEIVETLPGHHRNRLGAGPEHDVLGGP